MRAAPMGKLLSQLLHQNIQAGDGSPTILTLHAHNTFASSTADLAVAANPRARILAIESIKAVWVGKNISGYTWFTGPLNAPSPIYFGDSLIELERFLWDEIGRQQGPEIQLPFLLGIEQGAIMALAAAAAFPDLLSGVMAIEGSWPTVRGWEPPLAPLNELPILLVDTSEPRPLNRNVLRHDLLASHFRSWNASVSSNQLQPGESPEHMLTTWCSQQTTRLLSRDTSIPID